MRCQEVEMRARNRFIILLVVLLWPATAGSVELKYKFRPGSTYEYEYIQTEGSKASAFRVNSSRQPARTSNKFTLRAIDFQEGSFIIDVVSQEGTFRRYIRENGTLSGAPGETGQAVPFLITFPTGDWKPSEKHQTRQTITVGSNAVPAIWNLLLKSVDSEKQTAEILFSLTIKLPEDRLRRKEYNLKGRAIFDYNEGILQQAEWNSGYRFVFSNREMAVARNLWQFERQTTNTLNLVSGRE
jgi:hypothetical protein